MTKLLAAALLVATVAAPAAVQEPVAAVEVPLKVQAGRLVVPVEAADGTELRFALTTGSLHTVFSGSLAARLGTGAELTLGGLPVPTETIDTVADDSLGSGAGALDGMIGPNMLNQFDVLIDAPGERLVLKPVGRSVEWNRMGLSEPVRLRVLHGVVLALAVQLEGTEYPAMLDVGRPTLVVNERVRQETGLEEEGTGTLVVGGATFPDVPVRTLDLEIFRRWSPDGDGFVLVGAPVAHDCAIALSWVHRELRTCVR